ncbi:hypothetical protein L596_028007 [Steinernema carpocapsae]|uniref:Uncharacterized protein n=1 Tax=Steinernema carpocapsae TaxID=34508 RepID=A0A4U5LX92_STECR|nr:hypothetical protein L596_028007 [Steinernema carpocapsae]
MHFLREMSRGYRQHNNELLISEEGFNDVELIGLEASRKFCVFKISNSVFVGFFRILQKAKEERLTKELVGLKNGFKPLTRSQTDLKSDFFRGEEFMASSF